MSLEKTCLSLIRYDEGVRYKSYKDTSKEISFDGKPGLWTWGIGWCIETHPPTDYELVTLRYITGCKYIPYDSNPELLKWLDALKYDHAVAIADFMCLSYIQVILAQLETQLSFFPDLGDSRAAALVDMAFQMGVAGLLGFKITLGLMAKSKWKEASEEMLRVTSPNDWAAQTPERARRISNIIDSGEWPFFIPLEA